MSRVPRRRAGDAEPSVLHLDSHRTWGGGQNQVRLLMAELEHRGIRQLCLCPDGSALERRLRREGLPVRGMAWRGGMDPRALVRLVREAGHWDVLHAHDSHAVQMALLPARLRGRPLVAARRMTRPPRLSVWGKPAAVVAISGPVRDALLQAGVPESRVHTVPSGVDVEELRRLEPAQPGLRERIGAAADVFLAGSVGALVPPKNHVFLTQVAARLRDIQWVVMGEGPEREAIRQAVRAHGVGASFHLPGHLPDARRYVGELDVFVYPSLGEGLGTSVLDAMAREVPVIAADDAGPREILTPVHAATGTSLFPVGDADRAAELVRRVREEPAVRAAMLAAQRKRLPDYRAERTAGLTLDVYRAVVEAAR